MTRISLEIHDDVIPTLYKIKNLNDDGVDIDIPEGSVLFENIINLKLIEKEAEKAGITVHFLTKDEAGNQMILMLDETNETSDSTALTPEENDSATELDTAAFPSREKGGRRLNLALPKLRIRLPKLGFVKPMVLGVAIAAAIFGGAAFITRTQKAVATIKITSQPLVRSVTVKAGSALETSPENKTIRSTQITATLEGTKEADTTGEKLIGEKSEGQVKIYNNTDEDKKFKKGTELIYKDEYKYLTTEDIVVPEKIYSGTDPGDPSLSIYKKGEEVVKVVAYDIGEKYDLDEGKSLEVKGQKSSEFSAIVDEGIEGGKSEKVKAVAEEDKSNLKNSLLQNLSENIESELQKKTANGQIYIKGSSKITVIKETFSNETDDLADKINLAMTVQAEALSYMTSDLSELKDSIVKGMVPEGFKLSDNDTEIKAEVLGNSSKSILSSTEADLEVTIKTYIVPDIDVEKVKNELRGKKVQEAEKILGSLKNIKGYSFNISPVVPFLTKVPKDINRIEIKIERD